MLLESPTGSGKILIVGRTLESLRGELPRKCMWFWFAPYTGLVAQTRDTLGQQCSGLRLRDIYTDREPTRFATGQTHRGGRNCTKAGDDHLAHADEGHRLHLDGARAAGTEVPKH
jgi:hypothetical protein